MNLHPSPSLRNRKLARAWTPEPTLGGRTLCLGVLAVSTALANVLAQGAPTNTPTTPPPTVVSASTAPVLPSRPLSLAESLDIALQQNASVLKSRADLEATYGVVVQTRAIVLPKLQATGQYQYNDQIESLDLNGASVNFQREQSWNSGLRVVQSIYEGGRIQAALTTARLTKEQALLQHQTALLDVLVQVRVAYYDVLLAAQQIVVEDASVKLLQKELEDTTRRFNAGTVPRFNVLRAEVEVANAKPRLFRARNSHRIAKNNLAQLLGYRVPAGVWEDIPLSLSGQLDAALIDVDLPTALRDALTKRPELGMLRKAESLRREAITTAKAGAKPSVQLFGGYGWRSSSFQNDLAADVAGWNTGAQLSWNIFDGLATKGKVQEATAQLDKAKIELDDRTRQIELEVRTAYSTFVEAKEVLESQKKVVEQAEEALRLAKARDEAGTGTQLDVLNAQTALTQARTTQILALHDYAVAKARLERAIGQDTPRQ